MSANPHPEADQNSLEQRRKDWIDGYMAYAMSNNMGGFSQEYHYARARQYVMKHLPDPPQPREITLSNGLRCRMGKDTVMCWAKDAYGVMRWQVLTVCLNEFMRPEDLRALADLKERPNA